MKDKTIKYRAGGRGRTYGRGYKKSGRGSTGGAGASGVWSHKLRSVETPVKLRYVKYSKLLNALTSHQKTSAEANLKYTEGELIHLTDVRQLTKLRLVLKPYHIRCNFKKILEYQPPAVGEARLNLKLVFNGRVFEF